jgi:hypothetical protein
MRRIHDQRRAEFLTSHRIRLLRFWNHQLRQELESVLQAIWFAIEEAYKKDPSPSPSPKPTPLPSLALARPSLPQGEKRERRPSAVKSRSVRLHA